ncbi:DUF547 domain-containing protein [Thermodesulfobacteriota bacterium]
MTKKELTFDARTKLKAVVSLLIVFLFVGLYESSPAADGMAKEIKIDNSIYEELLNKYVKNGIVDYRGFKNEEKKLDQYLKVLEHNNPELFSKKEQFAFYVNAYNAWTIKLILTKYPDVNSIKDLGGLFSSPWKKKIVRINGKVLTLDNIEHDILRPIHKDPRVHFAVNCASKSCPPLRSEPYKGAELDRQLDEMAIAFINNPSRNRLEGDILWVSKIFSWYDEDFGDDLKAFILKYAEGDLKRRLNEKGNKIKIKYLEYDWSLNGK